MFTTFLLALAIVMCLALGILLFGTRGGHGHRVPLQSYGVAATAAILVALGVLLL